MNRRWICGDVWMDILPSFDRPQLGLKMALLSDRFDVLVDMHFDGKSELTIWQSIGISKGIGPEPKLTVSDWKNCVEFPLPDRPLPNKIRFNSLHIDYIDHSVIEFLRSNKQIWDRMGTNFVLFVFSVPLNDDWLPIWDVLAREILPIFATNIRHLYVSDGNHLDNLRRHISPTILTDLDQLISITGDLLPDGIADDGPNTTADQALSKWLHTPTKNGQPKRFRRNDFFRPQNLEWVNNFKETFLRATTSVSYNIQLYFRMESTPNEQFELVNEMTNEKLTLKQRSEEYGNHVDHWTNDFKFEYNWLLKRCPIGETAPVKFDPLNNSCPNLNSVRFDLGGKHCIGPLSPPAVDEEEEELD